ncbi:MAG: carboxypeptidase-like regulatory domain-containing protein, partial [Paludibacter sp.]|nr:carboxypeptidase-like regulatory domain-containing protein [Paludibacter sp.]
MKNKFRKIMSNVFFSTTIKKSSLAFLFLLVSSCFTISLAQNRVFVRGTVVSEQQEPIIGAAIVLKSDKTVGSITDIDGKFSLSVPSANVTIVVSYLGMQTQEIELKGKTNIIVT